MSTYESHQGQHQNCPPCFTIKIRQINFQGIGASDRRAQDKSRDADMWAYKRLRYQGIQPQHVFGSAEVETMASTQFEAEHHLVMSSDVRKEFKNRLEDSRQPKLTVVK